MLPQYFEAVRYRRWKELEGYARRRPSQGLANMVHELAETIGDKDDRKALRRILWILSQAGIEPGEEGPSAPKAEPGERLTYRVLGACSAFPNQHGYNMFLAYAEHAGKATTLFMHLHDRWKYCQAKEAKSELRSARAGMDSVIQKATKLTVEVDPVWVVSRMARAARDKKPDVPKGEPLKLPGLWKKIFERAEDGPHPSAKMTPKPQTPDQRGELLLNLEHIQPWRLSLHPNEEVWTDIHALRWNEELPEKERQIAIIHALREHKAELFRDEVTQDLSQRLRDAAYMLDVAGDPRGAMLLSVAHEFELKREASDFAHWLMGRTALDMNANLDEDEFDPGGDVEWV